MASFKMYRNLFIVVTVVSIIFFLFLTVDSLQYIKTSTSPMSISVVEGKKIWQQENCVNCHTILGNGAYFAPDLTKVADKRSKEWLMQFLQDPEQLMPGTAMSSVSLNAGDAEYVVSFLEWVSEIDTNGWPPQPMLSSGASPTAGENQPPKGDKKGTSSPAGQQIFLSAGCSNCHQIDGRGGTIGPDLSNIGAKRNADYLEKFIGTPKKVNPGTIMPAANLSEAKLSALVNYLKELK